VWYLLAIRAIVALLVTGTVVTMRTHPFGIGSSGAAAPKQHTIERTTGTEKSAPDTSAGSDKAATDKTGTGDRTASGTRTHEKATPTPGA
jgi:hypothetical protein